MGDLIERMMGFAADVNYGLSFEMAQALLAVAREGVSERDDDSREVRLGASGGKTGARLRRQTEFAGKPGKRVALNLIGRGRCAPGGKLRIEGRNQRIRNDRRHRHARVEESEVARVRHLHVPGS